MAFAHHAPAVSPLSTSMVLLLNLVIGLGHFLVLFNTGAYLPMIPHVAGSLGVNPDFADWTQADFFLAMALAFPTSPWFLQRWGEKILGPLLIIIGLFMLDVFKVKLPSFSKLSEKISGKNNGTYWGSFALGTVFAMAFCPYSAVLYFMMLIPLTIASPSGIYLPVIYAIATGLPVILFAWLIAYAVGNVGRFYNKIKNFELWFRRIVSVVFIGVGIYFLIYLFV